MNTGSLDREITLQSYSTTKDDLNDDLEQWTDFATVWAKVNERSGNVGDQAEKRTATRSYTFTIRYMANLQERMRIRYENQTLQVTAVREVGRKVSIELDARQHI